MMMEPLNYKKNALKWLVSNHGSYRVTRLGFDTVETTHRVQSRANEISLLSQSYIKGHRTDGTKI